MMNEARALVQAFDEAITNGERCALATIVSVEGSSYRRPGARMLISETGETTGTISAGCLEADVIEHAKRVLESGETKVVEYDNGSTTDDMAWGLGLGCNGIVRVLIEQLVDDAPYVTALRKSSIARPDDDPILVATVYRTDGKRIPVGARVVVDDRSEARFEELNGSGPAVLDNLRRHVGDSASHEDHSFDINGSAVRVFVERLLPPVPIVIFGAGHDALPIVELARNLGWQTEVVDLQARDASQERFALADRVTLIRSEDMNGRVVITDRTLTLVMSHNYSHDLDSLRFLSASPARYIGVMGPRKRTEQMLAELADSDDGFRMDLDRLHSPVGLDIGANGPTEIALSVIAEMRAVLEGKQGGKLRESRGPIQKSPVNVPSESDACAPVAAAV